MDALRALLKRVEAENVMEIDAVKESNYVARDGRRRGPAAEQGPRRWAILNGDGGVIGYMSGRFSGGIPDRDLPDGVIGGFISMIVIVEKARSEGHGCQAVREFAKFARGNRGTTAIGLRLDGTGDVARRRTGFERMGFEFDGVLGIASVDVLLAGSSEGIPT